MYLFNIEYAHPLSKVTLNLWFPNGNPFFQTLMIIAIVKEKISSYYVICLPFL